MIFEITLEPDFDGFCVGYGKEFCSDCFSKRFGGVLLSDNRLLAIRALVASLEQGEWLQIVPVYPF